MPSGERVRDIYHRVHRITLLPELAIRRFVPLMNDEPKMTFVSSCRLNGRTIFLLERLTTRLSNSEVVHEENGAITAFLSETAARQEIARRFPLPRGPVSDKSTDEELAGAMEDHYGKIFKFSYDLDAAREWARNPGPSGLRPEDALIVWELLFHVGEAPRPQRFDPMKMYAMQENIVRELEDRDFCEVVLLGMKLSGIVIMARERRAPADWNMTFPDLGEIWPETDYQRLGRILTTGIDAFERRAVIAS